MSEQNKRVLQDANAAVSAGDNEGFLRHCTEDIVWTTVGGETLHGKEAVRRWMSESYREPPRFTVQHLVAEGDFVVALGSIEIEDEQGRAGNAAYSDVWRLRNGKLAELRAFVIPDSG
ncbi:ketosteroid isomerase [Massilia sp. KIM]|uniref:nuclear transport factor 2 family protein n=1 Tax=Massilia sp. KIM TaxID=1955422 RepID=UPI00098F53AF|nr:nuclear transport factor 2 family protein [Massilia sp. KIM]OON62099.1 ketosteroid isomerase [Massilia sp. KIM]